MLMSTQRMTFPSQRRHLRDSCPMLHQAINSNHSIMIPYSWLPSILDAQTLIIPLCFTHFIRHSPPNSYASFSLFLRVGMHFLSVSFTLLIHI